MAATASLAALLGHGGTSVFRGGFALTNDYFGQALAVDFDLNNTLGFTSNYTTPANTYDTQVSGQAGLAPLFTGFNQDIRTLPNVSVPANLQFPLKADSDEGERIEQSVDSKLHAPTEYVWNFTFERQLPAGMVFSASYIGRMGRSLLARRDVVAFNNVRDPQSGVTWYEAGTALEKQRQKGIDTSQIATIPFFENLFPAGLGTMLNNDFGLDPSCSGCQCGLRSHLEQHPGVLRHAEPHSQQPLRFLCRKRLDRHPGVGGPGDVLRYRSGRHPLHAAAVRSAFRLEYDRELEL